MILSRSIPIAALVLAALAGPALAGDVRPPNNAAGPGPATGGGVSLPGAATIEAPPIRTTMEEKRKHDEKEGVDPSKVQELRSLAIEEFGQSSQSKDASK